MTEETLADVDHTHPHTDETFGGVYRRGPAVADGGAGAGPGVGVEGPAEECLEAVDHAGCPERTAADLWKRGPGAASRRGSDPDAAEQSADVRDGPAGTGARGAEAEKDR